MINRAWISSQVASIKLTWKCFIYCILQWEKFISYLNITRIIARIESEIPIKYWGPGLMWSTDFDRLTEYTSFLEMGQYTKSNGKSSTPGGYSTLVWVGVCRWDIWNATHPCTHFEGKVTHPCTKNQNFSLKFAPFWRKFRKILKSWPIKVPNLRHFGANFRKFWKIDPSKYHVFWKKKDPLMYLAAWFCYPCLRHIPITTFVLSTPPPPRASTLMVPWRFWYKHFCHYYEKRV